jgi:hypothetical protein
LESDSCTQEEGRKSDATLLRFHSRDSRCGHLEVVSGAGSGAEARSAPCPACATSFAGRRSHILCPRSPAVVSVGDAQRDAVDLRGSPRASARRGAFPTGMPSEGSFPKEHRGRRPPPSTSSPCPAWFFQLRRPLVCRAKLPSRNDSLHCNCWRSFNSLRNVRQMFNQTPRSSQSRRRRQQVEGCGYFSGRSCLRAPLRRIQRIPSNTRRFSIHGRPLPQNEKSPKKVRWMLGRFLQEPRSKGL